LFILAEVKKGVSPRDRESLWSLGISEREVEAFALALFLHWRNGVIRLRMLPDGLGAYRPGSHPEEQAARAMAERGLTLVGNEWVEPSGVKEAGRRFREGRHRKDVR
jgi:hypothetical protein